MKVLFANNIDKDILTALNTDIIPTQPIIDNNVKCSKSAVPNALYFLAKGEQVEFNLGTLQMLEKSLIAHCWIEHDGKVAQTRVPSPDVKLFKNFSITLSSDIEKAKKEIKDLVEFILE